MLLFAEKVIYRAGFNAMLGTDRIEVDFLEFVAKILMHVPDGNKRRVLGYGVYSSRALGERRKRDRGEEDAEEKIRSGFRVWGSSAPL